jgi:small subunit ribosomal protein S17
MTDAENNDNVDETTEVPEAVAPATEAAEPEAQLDPKERRRRSRSRHQGEASPARSVQDRTAERLERRRKKAVARRAWRVKSRERRRAASSGQGTPPAEKTTTGSPRVLRGVVVSDKADKTITVRIDTARPHRTYGKIVRSTSTLHAHDERNEAGAGDTVNVVESRPLSRTKRWRLVEVVERAR